MASDLEEICDIRSGGDLLQQISRRSVTSGWHEKQREIQGYLEETCHIRSGGDL